MFFEQTPGERRCGSTQTSTGAPCRAFVWERWSPHCPIHRNDSEEWLAEALETAYRMGEKAGRRQGRGEVVIAQRKSEVEERRKEEGQGSFHLRTVGGCQVVQVRFGGVGTFTYAWAGVPELQLGDQVKVPPFSWQYRDADPHIGEVCAIGSSYQGPLVWILGCT